MNTDRPPPPQLPRERIFNAPPAAVILAASIPVLFFLQTLTPDGGAALAFRPATLIEGGWWPGVLTSMFLHGGWPHALINAAFALAFGPPVARLFPSVRGALVFFAYYIVCGLIGTLGYGLVHLTSDIPMVGASGAVTGLLGGAVRLLGVRGAPRPLRDPRVLGMSLAVLALNAVTGLIGLSPGMETAGIAWEAHAFGYLTGLLVIGPLYRWFGHGEAKEPAPPHGPWTA